jgi:hypothetical protein
MDITLNVSLADVLATVARKTAYKGGKRQEDPKAEDPAALDRIATVDEDDEELRSFIGECRAEVAQLFSGMLIADGIDTTTDTYSLSLKVHNGFNTALQPAMEFSLKNYFVEGLLARWYMYVNPQEAAVHGQGAMSLLEELRKATIQRVFERKPWPLIRDERFILW